jgi:hypothetical protein
MSASNLTPDDDLPAVEIKITKAGSDEVVWYERYRVDPELAATLVDDLNEVIALLPAAQQKRITRQKRVLRRRNGRTVTRIDLTIEPRRPATQPSFQEVAQCLQIGSRRPPEE